MDSFLSAVKSKFLLKKILNNLPKKKLLKIIKLNKSLQKRLGIKKL